MLKIIRNIHLYTSLFLFLFVLMYIVSGFIMINHEFFPHGQPNKTVRTEALTIQLHKNPQENNHFFKREFNLSGRTQAPQHFEDGRTRYWIVRPGMVHELTINAAQDSITIVTTEQQTFSRIISRLHHLRNYSGGWLYNIWAFLLDCSAIAMVVFAISDIYLWYKRSKRKWLGFSFLAAGFIIPLIVVCYYLFAH